MPLCVECVNEKVSKCWNDSDTYKNIILNVNWRGDKTNSFENMAL